MSRHPGQWLSLWLACLISPASHADIILTGPTLQPNSLSLQVGSLSVIDRVRFDVSSVLAGNGTQIVGVPSTTTGSQINSVLVRLVSNAYGTGAGLPPQITLTADSSGGLTCVTTGCAGQVLPFNQIGWTSYDHTLNSGGGSASTTADIASGRFDGSASQRLLSYRSGSSAMASATISNSLVFHYLNPPRLAGTYQGRVTFTAVQF